jgi:hypothetical protein
VLTTIFCSEPFQPRRPDPAFADEVEAAEAVGLRVSLISHEALVEDGNVTAALRQVHAVDPPEVGSYRGWMMSPENYAAMYRGLFDRGVRLINSPEAYRHCHYLPEWYPELQDVTPRSVWLDLESASSMERVVDAAAQFGQGPLIVKDYVKSRKHEWEEACFIPSAADRTAVERVVGRFLELQGPELAGGLVLREFVELAPIGQHPKSGMPLTREFRIFVLDGSILAVEPYWEEGDYGTEQPPLDTFEELARRVPSRFFTVDVAQRIDGEWIVVELGDAQVAGLPDRMDRAAFYERLAASNPRLAE